MALKIDELNTLSTNRKAIPFEDYFGEMDLDNEQKEERIEHSKKLSPILFFIINLILVYYEYGYAELQSVVDRLREEYLKLLDEEGEEISPDVLDYIDKFAKDFVKTTAEAIDKLLNEETSDSFFISQERADVVAENEANVIYNFKDFEKAVKSGKKYKIWVTERDERVRLTHTVVDGKTLPIDEYFEVGDSYLLYPKDMSMGPSLTETANCRCTAIYI